MGRLKTTCKIFSTMLELATAILKECRLCDHCLGRQFALLGYGLANNERGAIIKEALVLELWDKIPDNKEAYEILDNIAQMGNMLARQSLQKKYNKEYLTMETKRCDLCDDLFENLSQYVIHLTTLLSKEDYQTFLIGAKMFPELIEKEDIIRGKFSISTGESIKSEFTREIGKLLMKSTNKEPNFDLPDITIIIDLPNQDVTFEKRSLFIAGRYRKFVRTIPQSKWPCWECNGKGCQKCNFTGKLYQESVEEIIAGPIMKKAGGKGTKFHGGGREDIDALMLGNGRPFVLEILNPQKRQLNLRKIEKLVNKKAKKKVEVLNLEFADKKTVQELKNLSEKTHKTYRAIIHVESKISDEDLQRLENELRNVELKQKTPQRVMHRRADLRRLKTVYEVKTRRINDVEFEAEITGDGGLYIKELISGDDGRTLPSFTSILGTQAICTQLDVIHLHKIDD
ncbi:MAG: tRNA pseudouridine(54/55) synthase Pus10 [Asgard group archaeon]|nr:tRNA pseudouridine(54/55) synthase Pus10 [Asgard group archaeon]